MIADAYRRIIRDAFLDAERDGLSVAIVHPENPHRALIEEVGAGFLHIPIQFSDYCPRTRLLFAKPLFDAIFPSLPPSNDQPISGVTDE
jgi:hypothetical protein